MKKTCFRKYLSIGIIILFVGTIIIPSTVCTQNFSIQAEDPSGYLYAISYDNGQVYRSTDQGATWQQVGSVGYGNCFAITSDINGSLYTINTPGAVFRSTDQGETWQFVKQILAYQFYSITSDINGSLYTIDAPAGNVFRSTDQGETWQYVGYIYPSSDYFAITSDIYGSLYVLSYYGQVYRSTDQGATWQQVGEVGSAYLRTLTSDINAYLYTIRLSAQVYRSIDLGITWQNIGIAVGDCFGMTSDIYGSLYAIISSGWVYRSTDQGATWQHIGTAGQYVRGITSGVWPPYDDISPEIVNITAQPNPQRTGKWVNISCNSTDNAITLTVKTNVTYPDGGFVNVTMSWVSNTHSYYFNTTYTELGIYDYFIWAKDPSGNTNVSTNYTFEIISNQPYIPSNSDPYDDEINVSINGNFSWDGGDPDSNDTVYYDVYLGTNSDPPFVERIGPFNASQTRITYDPEALNYSTHYYWKIDAEDNNGEISEGPIWNFTTEQFPPTASFTYTPLNPTKNDIIQFTDTSVDPDGTIISWWWDFGDEYYSSKQNPMHQYYEDGEYNVSLTVMDNNDSAGTIQKTIVVYSVNNPPGVPDIDGPSSGKVGIELCWTFNSTDPDGDDVYYYIDWGDETNTGWIGPYPSCTPVEVCHTYEKKGSYIIRVKVKDIYNPESDWAEFEVTIPRTTGIRLFLLDLLERFSNSFLILRHLLGL